MSFAENKWDKKLKNYKKNKVQIYFGSFSKFIPQLTILSVMINLHIKWIKPNTNYGYLVVIIYSINVI